MQVPTTVPEEDPNAHSFHSRTSSRFSPLSPNAPMQNSSGYPGTDHFHPSSAFEVIMFKAIADEIE